MKKLISILFLILFSFSLSFSQESRTSYRFRRVPTPLTICQPADIFYAISTRVFGFCTDVNTVGNLALGSGAANRITLWNGTNSLSSNSGFTFSGTGNTFDLTLGRDLIAGRQWTAQFGTVTPLSDLPSLTLRRFSNSQSNYIFEAQTEANAHLFGIQKDGSIKFADNSVQSTAATSGITYSGATTNFIPKSLDNLGNLTNSNFFDNGTYVRIIDDGLGGTASISADSSNGITLMGDIGGNGGGTIISVNDPAGIITLDSSILHSASFGAKAVVTSDGSSNLVPLNLNNGQILIGSTSNVPAAANLTAGTGISITNGANSITVSQASPILSGTSGSIGGAIVGIGCDTGTTTITGATTSMAVIVTPNTYPGDAIFWKAKVTSNDTVTVYVCSDVTVTPTSSTYNIRVIQ